VSAHITIPLLGGLGNQLFQLSAGLYLESELNRNVKFNYYLLGPQSTGYSANADRNLEIRDLVAEKALSSEKINPITLRARSLLQPKTYVWEKSPGDLAMNRISRTTKMAFGYFQNSIMVNAVWPNLKELMAKSMVFGDAISNKKIDQVAIHMRFGDYKNNAKAKSFHGLTTHSYYENALREIQLQKIDKKLKIFTDDPTSAKILISQIKEKYSIEFSENSSSIEDLIEMSRSSELIIGNSTFSWWAAWIASNIQNSSVIFPRPWFASDEDLKLPIYVNDWRSLSRNFDS
jgi:hypothetical protein